MTKKMQCKVMLFSSFFLLSSGLALADEYPSESPYRVYSEKSPQASNGILRNYIFEKELLSTSSPRLLPQAAEADLWYQSWEAEGVDGDSYGTHLTYTRGDKHSFTATVPIYAVNPDAGEDMTAFGIDGAYRFHLNDVFTLGAHANYIYESWSGDVEDSDSMSIGPFIAAGTNLGEKWTIAGALVYDYTVMSEDDDYTHYLNQIMPGATIGVQIIESLSMNVFGFYHALLEIEDGYDDSYYDAGVQFRWQLGSWAISLTGKKTFDFDNVEIDEIHLGTVFRW